MNEDKRVSKLRRALIKTDLPACAHYARQSERLRWQRLILALIGCCGWLLNFSNQSHHVRGAHLPTLRASGHAAVIEKRARLKR